MNVVIISHASLAAGLREAAEMILGKQEDLYTLGAYPGEKTALITGKIEQIMANLHDPENTLVLADHEKGIFSSIATLLYLRYGTRVIAGVNLPMLIDILLMRTVLKKEDLIEEALGAGVIGVIDVNKLLENS